MSNIFEYNTYIDEIYLPVVSIGDNLKPYYLISNYGRVYNAITNTTIIPHENENGYLQVSLMTETGRVFRKVHRLVMMTFFFFEGCHKYQVNHKNGNKKINAYYNLEWTTAKENVHHAIDTGLRSSYIGEENPKAILTEADVRSIVNMVINNVPDQIIIDTVCHGNVSLFRCVIYGKTWSHLISDDEFKKIQLTRKGNIISNEDKHALCRYYQDYGKRYTGYGSVTKLVKDALQNIGKDSNDMQIFRVAKRLYYRYEGDEITSLYNY